LGSLAGIDIRPTSDRLRETFFNVLCAGNPAALEGSSWLDLFAGTGAVGIEALSRGAGHVSFVESSPKAAALIEKNLLSLKIDAGFEIVQEPVGKALRKLEGNGSPATFIFLDPPYGLEAAYRDTLGRLSASVLAGEATVVIAEHQKHFDPGDKVGNLQRYRKLQQGDAVLSFYKKAVGDGESIG
jgi:16S rRNA (guanine966-N2)-methyltransferase